MLVDLVQNTTEFIEKLILTVGPLGILAIAFMENMFPPTPSEVLYPLAGKLAFDGKISFGEVVIAGVLGSMLGAVIWYTLGFKLGDARMRSAIDRYGRLRVVGFTITIVSVEEYNRGMNLFRRHGSIIVFVARIMPLVHGVVSIPAGVVRMNLGTFLLFTALGAAAWIAPLTWFGLWLGDNWEEMLHWIDVYQNVWYLVMGLAIILYLARRIYTARSHPKASTDHVGDQ
jgi:membrane protein DedA with SNARE-associated domain